MDNQKDSSKGKKVQPEEELKHFKAIVKSIMDDASKALAEIILLSNGSEIEEKISLLDHYLDYVRRLCESDEEVSEKVIV